MIKIRLAISCDSKQTTAPTGPSAKHPLAPPPSSLISKELSPVDEREVRRPTSIPHPALVQSSLQVPSAAHASQLDSGPAPHRRSVSAQGLHLVIPPPSAAGAGPGADPHSAAAAQLMMKSPGGGSSGTSSPRDQSPTRELSPLITLLKPPIFIRRGPRGFGFTLRAIRVYIGQSDYYTLQHIVTVRIWVVFGF